VIVGGIRFGAIDSVESPAGISACERLVGFETGFLEATGVGCCSMWERRRSERAASDSAVSKASDLQVAGVLDPLGLVTGRVRRHFFRIVLP